MRRIGQILPWLALGVAVGSGFALLVPASFGLAFRIAVVLHGPTGLLAAVVALRVLVRHARIRASRATLRWAPAIAGLISAIAWSGCVATGVLLALNAVGLVAAPFFRSHMVVAMGALGLAVLHSLRGLIARRENLPEVRRGMGVTAFAALVSFALTVVPQGHVVSARVVAGGPSASFGPGIVQSEFDRLAPDACAMSGCHPAVVEEHRRSAHAISFRSAHFAAIVDRLLQERPDQAGFCTGCHLEPTFDGRPAANSMGVGCLTCHAARRAAPGQPFGGTIELEQPAGHLELLRSAAPNRASESTPAPVLLARALLRGAAGSHRRAFPRLDGPEANELCLTCHGVYVPRSQAARFAPDRCAICHMEGQMHLPLDGALARPHGGRGATSVSARHLFVGSNSMLFASLGDSGMAEATDAWMRGELVFDPQVRFWNFDSQYTPPQHGTWFSVRLAPAETPRAGAAWPVEVATVNVGVGHPFPSAPMDLVQVRLEGELKDRHGDVLWRVPEEVHYRLGGEFLDESGGPLRGHRLWIPHHLGPGITIDRGRTTVTKLDVPIPSDRDRAPLQLTVRWRYCDLTASLMQPEHGAAECPASVVIGSASAVVDPSS